MHPALDRAREAARGDRKIGTTGRGIGPAYEDKAARRAIRVADLAEPETLADKLDELLLHHNTLLQGLGAETFSKDEVLARLLSLAPKVLPFAEPVWERLDEARRAGTAHPVRGRAGGDAGCGPRHLPLCYLKQYRRGDRGVRRGCWAIGRWVRAGHRQGLQHTRRLWAHSRQNWPMPRGSCWATAVTSTAPILAAAAVAAGSTLCWCARR